MCLCLILGGGRAVMKSEGLAVDGVHVLKSNKKKKKLCWYISIASIKGKILHDINI